MRDEDLIEYHLKSQLKGGRRLRRRNWYKACYILSILAWLVFIVYLMIVPAATEDFKQEPLDAKEILEDIKLESALAASDVNKPASEPSVIACPYYNVPLSCEIQDDLRCVCDASGIDMTLALAVIQRETNFRNIIGDNGDSFGYMQVQPRWHKDRMDKLGVTDLMDPAGNFRVGCDYLAELLTKYPLEQALTCYNTGRSGYNQYARDVIGYMEELK